MLVSATEMLQKAKAGHYAVGQFNINNLEWTKAILTTAQELNSPVILGVSEGAGKYMTGYKTVVGMVNGMMEELGITVPVALHLDHGSYEGCLKCVEAGFSSIMFDGSHYPIEENVEKTKELVKIAHEHGMSIEAEVGSIGGEEDGVIGRGECADPEECKRVADLGIDFLAAGIGNIHGKYPANWEGLSFETLDAIQQRTGAMPLVLHGGTGIPEDMIKKAISLGVAKINVNTECFPIPAPIIVYGISLITSCFLPPFNSSVSTFPRTLIFPCPVSYILIRSSLLTTIPPVGKSGPFMYFISCFVVIESFLIYAFTASITSPRL